MTKKKYNSFGKVISKSICLMTCGEENPSQKGGNHLLKDIFTKKKKYASVPSDQAKHDVPEGIMTKCPKCKKIMLTKELDKNMRVCMNCDYHFPMNAKQRIESLMDEQSFEEFNQGMLSENPLGFPGYLEKLEKIARKHP